MRSSPWVTKPRALARRPGWRSARGRSRKRSARPRSELPLPLTGRSASPRAGVARSRMSRCRCRSRQVDDSVGVRRANRRLVVSHWRVSFSAASTRSRRPSFRAVKPKVARPDACPIGPCLHPYCYASARRKAMTAIVDVHARQILDSRGNPTVEVDVTLEDGSMGRAAVPSGASTGAHEARRAARRRQEPLGRQGRRQGGRRRSTARSPRRSSGCDAEDQAELDAAMIELDGTENKGRLGANAILGVSLAAAKAAADARGLPLYRYVGGVDAQPAAGADDEHPQRRRARRQRHRLPGIHGDAGRRADLRRGAALRRRDLPRAEERACTRRGLSTAVGDEGGFAPDLNSAREALDFILTARSRPRATSRRRRAARARPRGERVLQGRRLRDGTARARASTPAEMADYLRRAGSRLSDRLDRGRHGRGRLRRAGRR